MKKGLAVILGLCAGVLLFAGCETGTQPAAQASLPTEQEMREYYADLVTWPVKVEEEWEDTLPEVTLTTESAEYPADVKEIPLTLTNEGTTSYTYGPYPTLEMQTADGWYSIYSQGNPGGEEYALRMTLEGETTKIFSPPFLVQPGNYEGYDYDWLGDKTLLPGHYRIALVVSFSGKPLASSGEAGESITSYETVEFDIVA